MARRGGRLWIRRSPGSSKQSVGDGGRFVAARARTIGSLNELAGLEEDELIRHRLRVGCFRE